MERPTKNPARPARPHPCLLPLFDKERTTRILRHATGCGRGAAPPRICSRTRTTLARMRPSSTWCERDWG
eukprot:7137919-Prorocentrum_lima.AAC.1